MKKLLISFILSLFVAICSFASVAVASECTNDPNECTLIKLCEVSISIDGEKINWSTDTAFLKHVALAQKLDINCGVTTTVDLCDADPNECKVSEICQKATTKDDGTIRWDKTAEAYVTLAKKFGLKCDVNENVSSEVSSKTNKAVSKIFNYKSDFTSKSLLRRKQIQYALKDLGLYSSSIDGLWGKGTSEALNAFVRLNGQEDYSFSQIYNSLKAKVDLPSSFNLSAPSAHNNIYDSKPDYKCTMRKINFQGMGFKFITNNGMTSSTISSPDGTQKFNSIETKKMLAEFSTDGVDNNILLWFRGNKVTLGYPNMQDIVSKAINDTSADERVQMQKIINKMFEPVFFQKYNNTISWNQFVPKELKKEIAFRDFSINYSFKLNTQNFLAVMKLNLNGQKVEGQINYECKKGKANNQTKTRSDNLKTKKGLTCWDRNINAVASAFTSRSAAESWFPNFVRITDKIVQFGRDADYWYESDDNDGENYLNAKSFYQGKVFKFKYGKKYNRLTVLMGTEGGYKPIPPVIYMKCEHN